MKRYNHLPINSRTGGIAPNVYIEDIECEDGEWVRYKDVEAEMKRIWGDIEPMPDTMLKHYRRIKTDIEGYSLRVGADWSKAALEEDIKEQNKGA